MATVIKDLGAVTAYGYAKEKGYTGTEDEFAELMASYADVAEQAAESAAQAGASATAAEQAKADAVLSASAAASSASTASTKASEAASSASSASGSANTATTKASEASASATSAASSASAAATSATNAGASATAAAGSASSAETAKTAAETAQGKAETAQGAAETAAQSVSASAAQITQNAEDIGDLKSAFDKVATLQGNKPSFVFGVYTWNPLNDAYTYQSNQKRACAQLKDLSLSQGDTVGITDYTTYSIAFGDNFNGWYNGGYQSHDITANDATILPYVLLVKRNDDADMTENDLTALANQFHSTGATGEKVIFTEAAIDDIRARTGAKNGFVHLSFDDVGYCITDLANNSNSFSSVWNEPFFGKLKELHDSYGAVFSLYVWDVSNLDSLPSKYKSELSEASEWLKFGFHAFAEGSLANASYSDAKTAYDTFIANVFDKIGGVNSVDRMPRLNYFAGNLDALKALRDANCGCIGFLNTDDSRDAYYLSADELAYLRTHSIWTDRTNGLQFVSTVMRLDWFVDGFSSQYDYNVPVQSNPYDELVYRYGQPAMADLYSGLVVFTHEWQIYSSNYVLNAAMVSMVEQVCRFANDYRYDFDYPQNRVENITSYAVGEIVIDNFTTTVHGEWSFGAVQDGGNIVSSETRICTTPFKASKVVVSFPSGYKVNVCRYNSANADSTSFVDRTDWQYRKQSLTGDYYYVIVASTTENTASLDIADLYTITAVRNINDL